MKKNLPLLFIIVAFKPVNAQDFNSARHRFQDQTTNMVSVNSKSFYMEASLSDSINLVGVSTNGQTLFKTKLNSNSTRNKPVKVIKTLDKKILTLGWQNWNMCDAVTSYTAIISKCDTNGTLVFQIGIPESSFLDGAISDMTQHPDSSFYFINSYNNANILHYSKTGVAMSTIITAFSTLNSITALANGNLLVNGIQNNVLKNAELTTAGNLVNQQTTNLTMSGFAESTSGRIYGLESNGSIRSFSANLQPLNNSLGVTGQNMRIKDFKLRNDTVFCTGSLMPLAMPYYAILGPNLNLVYQTQSAYKGVTPSGITVNTKNRVSIITMGSSASTTIVPFSGLFQTTTTGSFMPGSDVGVIGYSALTSTVYQGFSGMGGSAYIATLNMTVQVKNFGMDTVKSFYLNNVGNNICDYSLHKKYMATIAPNSVITVTTGAFSIIFNPPANAQGISYSLQVCPFTTIPNFYNDTNIDNDSWCGQVDVSIPLGIYENSFTDPSVQLYPNPAQQSFKIEAANTITHVQATTVTGSVLYSESASASSLFIDTDSWPNGIYFVKVETEKGSTVKKIMKN